MNFDIEISDSFWILLALCLIFFAFVCFMILVIIGEKQNRLVNIPVVLRPLIYPFEQKVLPFCIPRDRWDKEFYNLQGG